MAFLGLAVAQQSGMMGTMQVEEFRATLAQSHPPKDWGLPLQALWWEAKGDWSKAHELCQEAACKDGDHVHAYLHRVEGDEGNAGYWYSRAGVTPFRGSLQEEWNALVARFQA
jgi:hypothetical protein